MRSAGRRRTEQQIPDQLAKLLNTNQSRAAISPAAVVQGDNVVTSCLLMLGLLEQGWFLLVYAMDSHLFHFNSWAILQIMRPHLDEIGSSLSYRVVSADFPKQ